MHAVSYIYLSRRQQYIDKMSQNDIRDNVIDNNINDNNMKLSQFNFSSAPNCNCSIGGKYCKITVNYIAVFQLSKSNVRSNEQMQLKI